MTKKVYVKKLKLRESVKEKMIFLSIIVVCIIALVGLTKLLEIEKQNDYKRAIERCGNESNIVERHTKEGDTYYTCSK